MNSNILNISADIIGIIGVVVLLVAYFLLQADRIGVNDKSYSFMNLIGAIFIIISLLFNWNTPAMLVESAWVVISFWGLVKSHQRP